MKISLITVVYNGEAFLRDCFDSVFEQTYPDVEYIVIDGGSTDQTLGIIEAYRSKINYFVSERDNGLYDAINKGIEKSTGEVIGILNSDDTFANPRVLQEIANHFSAHPNAGAVYGDLNYVHPRSGKVIRTWTSKQAKKQDLQRGWMPAHPTLYIKKTLFNEYGHYACDLGTAADYDQILRLFYRARIEAVYIPQLLVNMRIGGVSNRSFKSLLKAFIYDYKAMKRNKLPYPYLAIILKKLSKLKQF